MVSGKSDRMVPLLTDLVIRVFSVLTITLAIGNVITTTRFSWVCLVHYNALVLAFVLPLHFKVWQLWRRLLEWNVRPCYLRTTLLTLVRNILMTKRQVVIFSILEGRNKAVKKKIMVGVGALNVISGAILCVGVSYFASTVLQEYNGMNGLIMRGSGSMSSGSQRSATGERYVYGQCLFIGWGAMIIDIVGGAIILCGSCGSSHSVGTESFYGTQGRLMSNQYAPNVDNIVNKWKTNPQQKDGSVNGQQYI